MFMIMIFEATVTKKKIRSNVNAEVKKKFLGGSIISDVSDLSLVMEQ